MVSKHVKVFIIGSPRSGTTYLGKILESHPQVGHIYEPYYIWYYHARDLSTDYITPEDIGQREQSWIRGRFEKFRKLCGRPVIVDKSPEHSFNLPIVSSTFPNAKFIHILRDGRDVVLSIKKEWAKRRELVESHKLSRIVKTARAMLNRQPYWRFRVLAAWYELKTNRSLNPLRYFNKAKWEGGVGWGPRFKGWREALVSQPLIAFNARQWLECVTQIENDLPNIPGCNTLEVRYENLVSDSHLRTIREIGQFLDLDISEDFVRSMPPVRLGNTGKWRNELSRAEVLDIGPVLTDKLIELGYEQNERWYEI
jgi:hypothetical protein